MHQSTHQSGFILPDLIRQLKTAGIAAGDQIDALLSSVANFQTISSFDLSKRSKDADSLLCVLHNLIVRGAPTFIPLQIEAELAKHLDCLEDNGSTSECGYRLIEQGNEVLPTCWDALHLIDPRLTREEALINYHTGEERMDSQAEEHFFFEHIPQYLAEGSGDFLLQLFQTQRSMDSIVGKKEAGGFWDQRIDFALEFPYQVDEKRGLCLEVDGPHHLDMAQKTLDHRRDEVALKAGYNTFRFPVGNFGREEHVTQFHKLKAALNHPSIKRFQSNYQNPLYRSAVGRVALQLMLSPMAIARIQLVLAKAIIAGALSLEAETWNIAVLEKDVPCAKLAIDNFMETLRQLVGLEKQQQRLPKIALKVYVTPAFQNFELNRATSLFLDEELSQDETSYDLYIEISTLQRTPMLWRKHNCPSAKNQVQIFSAYHHHEPISLLFSERIQWRELWDDVSKQPIPAAESALTYFLQNIFRKKGFRPGQIPILNWAMQNQSVIGLLPTGGGKSLTYQIAGLLQPCMTLVVDPIKSLMKDQVDGLKRMGIHRTVYINSSLSFKAKQQAQQKMRTGKALFAFVSPERLQMDLFRALLKGMFDHGIYFAYGVIDEVHCVSEWGHDFRTSYLFLGKNLLEHCRTKTGKVTLFGLTATASYDVLVDVQRELSGNEPRHEIPDERIIRHETTIRDEVQFVVDKIEIEDEQLHEIIATSTPQAFAFNINTAIGKLKQERSKFHIEHAADNLSRFLNHPEKVVNADLLQLIYEDSQIPSVESVLQKIRLEELALQNFWLNEGLNAGIIFTPHRKKAFGVEGVQERLALETNVRLGTFMGVNDEDPLVAAEVEQNNLHNQDAFLANQLDVMVATKAFGMGIDKSNIRLAIHNNYPGSIESFVQEAGRVGRDGKMAVSVILFNEKKYQHPNTTEAIDPDFEKQLFFHHLSFKGTIKEKAVLAELLTQIIFPTKSNNALLCAGILPEEKEVSCTVLLSAFGGDHYLWLNDNSGETYGNIRWSNGQINTNNATVEANLALQAMQQLYSQMEESGFLKQPVVDFQNWLNKANPQTPEDGIEKHLVNLEEGASISITIPFQNDHHQIYRQILHLCGPMDPHLNTEIISRNIQSNGRQFLEKLAVILHWATGLDAKILLGANQLKLSAEQFLQRLELQLNSIREKSDTEKALYRLSLIGVIDDYTVDFRTKTFTIKVTKKPVQEYKNHLRNYLSKFYTTRRVEEILEELPSRKGASDIQRILNFLIEFLYEEIAKKRFEAINAMRALCTLGYEGGNIEIKSFIHLYFNSKYAQKEYYLTLDPVSASAYRKLFKTETDNVSLNHWTEGGKNADIDLVFDYMQLMLDDYNGAQINNLKHLRGACTRLLIVYPDNYVLRLLRAYAMILLSERQAKGRIPTELALSDLETGFLQIYQEKSSQKALWEILQAFNTAILHQIDASNTSIRNEIEAIFEQVLLLIHSEWTKTFTQTLSSQLNHIMP
ncbi:DEAD/DEAH box helicase [Haliscomenobacter hydrossis]|uniref:Helicase domain-containing protein n=1 Tax=Haliscomenobacter hydrossis (strain ATCC 27775 / DSM 1100 / LMG 10767 / O) TaxID=760192 RepID=F4L855_HALH1|nr:DEAD/DEAH box helicase [Haliscomenobacter hydrossis]AEE54563.1 helicase domain-containing protein [Haliscomenobacter hydrossis DSM 1100]